MPIDAEVLLRLESFIDKYPEIDRVTYYREDGSTMYSIVNGQPDPRQGDSLSVEVVRELGALVSSEMPYKIESSPTNARAFEILAPIWTESIAGDGLFDFDPMADSRRKSVELIGFVGINLDFMLFHNHLLKKSRLRSVYCWFC
jgi:hypothetical protein